MQRNMGFDEAMLLARLIRERPGWYVLEVSACSGEKLEDDHWSVAAVSILNWRYFHYWCRAGSAEEWPKYVDTWEAGTKMRESAHEQ